MRLPLRLILSTRARGTLSVRHFASSPIPAYGRTAIYRRLGGDHDTAKWTPFLLLSQTPSSLSRICNLAYLSQGRPSLPARAFTSSSSRFQDQRPGEEIRDPPRSKRSTGEGEKTSPGANSEGPSPKKGEESPGDASRNQSSNKSDESAGEHQKENTGKKGEGNKKKEEPPPPPPHGDKTPWQVFTETLKTEFQKSNEWNESTKALASSAHQFSESESVKRARAAYSAASGAATSTTSSALKETGKVLGQGAAWTWETPVVKGVRSGVKATGRGIEKVTRPVRETKVYKTTVGGVKDVIDDGSSSRYGGWVEKEERRKKRGLREQQESQGVLGKNGEKIVEDPK